jgi:ubiquitin-protein ligase
LGGAVQPSAPTAHRELLLSISPLHDTQQIVESQAKVLGADNATRRARMAAARTYKADPAALRALVGEYTSVIG